MTKKQRKAGASGFWEYEDYNEREERGFFAEYGPMLVGGVLLVLAFAFAGHYMGENAVAHNADQGDVIESLAGQTSNILAKGSLVPDGTSIEVAGKTSLLAAADQMVEAGGKGDRVLPRQASIQPKQTTKSQVRIVPASVNLSDDNNAQSGARVVLAPPPQKVLKSVQQKRVAATAAAQDKDAQKAIALRRMQLAEENCLARAVYFEARSESQLGQLAVAKVILNRVKDPEYPKSICGVVYQGSGRRNSCQFSFACDGLPDDVKSPGAWANAKRIAQKAISGDAQMAALGTATNYHADYVRPAWAKSMKRIIKIGHHVFYEEPS